MEKINWDKITDSDFNKMFLGETQGIVTYRYYYGENIWFVCWIRPDGSFNYGNRKWNGSKFVKWDNLRKLMEQITR